MSPDGKQREKNLVEEIGISSFSFRISYFLFLPADISLQTPSHNTSEFSPEQHEISRLSRPAAAQQPHPTVSDVIRRVKQHTVATDCSYTPVHATRGIVSVSGNSIYVSCGAL